MTLQATDRQALIDNSRYKSHAAVENVAFLLANDKLTLAVNQVYYGIFICFPPLRSNMALRHPSINS